MNKSIFLQRPHEGDLDHYLSHLKERNTATTNAKIVEKLKVLHRKIYYLNLLSQSLNMVAKEKRYLNEIVTDLILCMDLFSLNYMKPTRMGLRAAIEEFNRLLLVKVKEEVKNLGVYKLNEKVKEKFKEDNHIHGKISQLLSDYKQLCDFTHVSDNNNFTNKLVLDDFKFIDRSELNHISNQIVRVVENMIFIIICQYKSSFLQLNKHQQAFIIDQLKETYQSEIEYVLDE
ncbi:hypothetical protein [Peribacillus butanolivorans]|uniref:Uncharacterized protein n=1 Tax=Peribacillus butanolivorans TaxID=421767 RepID=A0ABN5N5L6_9BACI|nr:hypothetical protein [Peribacillus butanolivorans]AXN39628.1 hypothetical protein DTO10_15470 [Peribacillus butanolivorans]